MADARPETVMSERTLLLLTTCHLESDGTKDLRRLIDSVAAAIVAQEIAGARHIVLLQGCTKDQAQALGSDLPRWVELLSTERRLSSPAARNRMIDHLWGPGEPDADAVVAFPDDDAWYPPGALGCIVRLFDSSQRPTILLGRYGPDPSAENCPAPFRANLQQALTRGACAAMFLSVGLLKRLGGFNEILGLGTRLSGGEDTEFVHRAYHFADGRAFCIPGVIVGHEAANPAKKAKYFEGGLAALMAHREASTEARLAYFRKLAVGVWLVLARRMSPQLYMQAIARARAASPVIRDGLKAAD